MSGMRSCGAMAALCLDRPRSVLAVLLGLFITLLCLSGPARAEYRSEAWQGKFLYGAYSTLISSHVMRMEFPALISLLSDPRGNEGEIEPMLREYVNRYRNLKESEVDQIIDFARRTGTTSIFEEERSIVSTNEQNIAFMDGMRQHPELMPVDNLIVDGTFHEPSFQYNTHRSLYNNAYGIPQNSLAAMVNAYVAGIRSIEFDILSTQDGVSVVVHDLVTNRLTGDYGAAPVFVERTPYSAIANSNINILNPLGIEPKVEVTDVTNVMKTEDVLWFVTKHMPEMTMYLDARNDAPVAAVRLLAQKPLWKDKVVLKIYPFLLNGGASDLVARYAQAYSLDPLAAEREIIAANVNILLAVGRAALEADERTTLPAWTDFSWQDFERFAPSLPFSSNSNTSANTIGDGTIFRQDELPRIQALTYIFFRWSMDFSRIGNVMVIQMSSFPSLKNLASAGRSDIVFEKMSSDERIIAAVEDNFLALYRAISAGDLSITMRMPEDKKSNLRTLVARTIFGLSDRYPDFSFAERDSTDSVQADTLINFYYSMLGGVYTSDGFGAQQTRSTTALLTKAQEMTEAGFPVLYATTDLPTDLRFAAMGLLGQHGLPRELLFRPSAMIKPAHNHLLPHLPRSWSTHLYGERYTQSEFRAWLDSLARLRADIAQKQKTAMALETFANGAPVLVNSQALQLLGVNALVLNQPANKERITQLTDQLGRELADLRRQLEELQATAPASNLTTEPIEVLTTYPSAPLAVDGFSF